MYIKAHVIEDQLGRGSSPIDKHEYINADYIVKMEPVDIYLKEHDVHVYYVYIHMHTGEIYRIQRDSYLDAIELINHLLDCKIAGTDIATIPDDVKFKLCRCSNYAG